MSTQILGFDFGEKRIGIAFGQSITKTASPITTLKAKDGNPDWQLIEQLIKQWLPNLLIVGLPLNMDGTEQPITKKAKKFARRLQRRFQLPVEMMDERLTSKAVKWEIIDKHNKKKNLQRIDSYAACLIVESWLNDSKLNDSYNH